MTDFLLELRSEEIPARMQAGARADLEKLFRKEMDAAGVALDTVAVWSTPRRLALIATGLPETTEAVSEETKGPATSAPDQALAGFLGKVGLTKDQLEVRDVKGKPTYFAVVEKPGRSVRDVLAEAIPAIVRAFPWPKSQRWGAASISTESLRWVRPLSGIVAILGEDLVECEVGGIASGYVTKGHRFHHPHEITIGSAHDYADKLRACHVLVNHEERQDIVREKAREAAAAAGLTLVEDEGLVIENAGLTEWSVPLLGRFDEAFLEVPPEVIQLTARVNQKYFVCEDSAGKLANAFVCTANIAATDGGAAIVDGNRKVLAARLSDARFFWEQDKKTPLSVQAEKLGRITFHEKLGTVADKVERVAKLAEWLANECVVPDCDPALARQAAELCKADLVTEMVGEFPELQGLMGGYYARAEGLPDAVADAIRDHYKPVGQGDEVPTAPVTVAVSLADKLDTLACFYCIDEKPTGSKDPFALRRAAISIIQLLIANSTRASLTRLLLSATHGWYVQQAQKISQQTYVDVYFGLELVHGRQPNLDEVERVATERNPSSMPLREQAFAAVRLLLDFFADRLKVQQKEAGVRHDLIDAVFALGGEDDLVRLLARVHALQAFVETEDGTNLLAGYKRAANILKKEGYASVPGKGEAEIAIARTGDEDPLENVDDPDMRDVYAARKGLGYEPEAAEKALMDALDVAAPKAAAAVAAEDFSGAMAALATLRNPIDTFFADVTVNDPDPLRRDTRLALLDTFRVAVHNVADFSRIEG
ncbi:glycine--tRNA ligase subunit beta [Novosphingobium album (ex Hu et al. 2023)]|uniref:Glycine--tRNA ligase beta subunit n=1 Tax=Novosphingobium album (ex Hu et al. 2023) TaxID=2930093 RepID=A0ABT0AY24_9SPHN|nr:glycine--tRNA ligase subunit beta [Novosphingobium album (ex Hu et al. 2023)]MCJ2177449.1 glycine--tRNA ligase subunit beta [Novosphingobium album (ex Hu et al. 2023)]